MSRLTGKIIVVQDKRLEFMAITIPSGSAINEEELCALLCRPESLPEPLGNRKAVANFRQSHWQQLLPMGILPGGTGNVLSLEVGIPQTLAEAAKIIVSENSTVRQIDVGQCDAANWEGSRYFLLRVASGFDAQRINMTSRELRDKYGRMAYFIGALQAVPESKAVRYTFTLDGEDVEVKGFTCLVENAGNMGIPGISLASDVSISDGLLDVFCVYNLDFASLSSAAKSITNQPLDPESFRHWRAREVTIASDPPQPIVGDGEKWGETPVTVKVLPGAIGVITPADAS
jgi:diacylglycerol kinase family enzyme